MAQNVELNPFAMPDRVDSANSVEHEACFQANMSFEPSTISVQQTAAYEPAAAAPAPKRKRNADTVWVRILRQSVAHAFDIGFVALSIAAAITSVILVMGAEATQSHFRTMIPFTIDGYLTVALSVTAVYATYVVYWLLFKIVGGNTLGNHFFGYSAKKSLEAEGSSLTQEHQQIEMF